MSYEPPAPPEDLSDGLVESLEGRSPESLRWIARYADALAEYREREDRLAEDTNDEDEADGSLDLEGRDDPDERPADVPSKASITIKEINDNRYYYWQWREGDRVRSQYEGPVCSDQ